MVSGGGAAGRAAEGIIANAVKDLLRVASRDVEKGAASGVRRSVEKDLGRTLEKDLDKNLGRDLDRDATRAFDDRALCGDPVDVATGEVVTRQVDVDLAGLLPLVLTRTHTSSYRRGRHFGRSWSSTLDQRLEVDAAGVCFLADEAMVLYYPRPDHGEQALPERGPRWALTATGDGGYAVTQPERGCTLWFASLGEGMARPLVSVRDRNDNRIDIDRDPAGTPTLVRHSGGYQVAVLTANGLVTELRLLATGVPDGVPLVRFGYDAEARLVEVTNSSGLPMVFDYDADGRMTGWQDRNGVWYRYTYDDRGRCVRTAGRDGYLDATFAYDDERMVTAATNSLGHTTTYHLDRHGQVIREVDPLGHTTLSEWDSGGRLTARTDPLGHTIRYSYDTSDDLVALVRPDGAATQIRYDRMRRPISVTEPDGAVWRYTNDIHGNLLAVTDPTGTVTRYGHDQAGRLTSVTDGLGRRLQVGTNAAGLVTSMIEPDGSTTRYERDVFGRVSAITDPLGNTTGYGWTVEGSLAWRTLPDGAVERWNHDAEGNLVSYVDPLGQVTSWVIGAFDLPVATVGPDGRRTVCTYDTELRLKAVTNPAGQTWSYSYDPAGLLASETDINGRTLKYGYDAAGRLVLRANEGGQVIRLRRDVLGNVVEQRHGLTGADGPDDAEGADSTVTRFVRDRAGRVVRATGPGVDLTRGYDPVGRIITETTNGRTISFDHDVLGRRTTRRTPTGLTSAWEYGPVHDLPVRMRVGGQEVRFGYDAAGREVARRVGPELLFVQKWDANSRLGELTLTAGGLADAPAEGPSRLLHRRTYAYRADGFPTGVDDHRTGPHHYTLDRVGRITAVAGPQWSERYAYDVLDNLVAADWPLPVGGPAHPAAGDRSYTGTLLRAAGRTRYEHDGDGRLVIRTERTLSGTNRTWRYTWNAEDQLTDLHTPDGSHWRYRYDPFGRRIAKEQLGSDGSVLDRTVFCWDGTQLAEQTRTHPHGGRTTTWEYRSGTYQPLTQTDTIGGSGTDTTGGPPDDDRTDGQPDQDEIDRRFHAIVTDLVGAPTELVTLDGQLAWEQRRTLWGTGYGSGGVVSCPLRFPGQYFDPESGLHHNHARLYDPATAGYLSADPLGRTGGPNPHGYVPNPTVWLDPLGLAKCRKRVVYRQLNADDRIRFDAGQGLVPKGRSGDIAAHVRGDPTRHISASMRKEQTARFASGNGLVEIDVDAAIGGGARFIDHNNVMQAARRAPDSTRLAQFAERAGEVLFIDQIPFHSMKLIG
ncbi:MAG TPA: DUF6531 domain-containing protein [Mycobacteriales bacterium]